MKMTIKFLLLFGAISLTWIPAVLAVILSHWFSFLYIVSIPFSLYLIDRYVDYTVKDLDI